LKDELDTSGEEDLESIYYDLKEVAGRIQQDLDLLLGFVKDDLAGLPSQTGFAALLSRVRQVECPELNLENFELLEEQVQTAAESVKKYLKVVGRAD
jgi:hypothetical protein